ncbi:MAG TPA: universal stress protein [Rhodocyclaceae bacterium]|jgi:nucleotide-binding universal stress UspA family protein|nr:universal stress protein [Rhodocyclaceae bacterium]
MKILVATDGSKPSLNAVKYAAKLAASLSTKDRITLINVHDDAPLRQTSDYISDEEIADILRRTSEKQTASSLKILDKTNVPHDCAMVTGNASAEIVKFANKGKFDLIVLGGKGRSSFTDLLLGSVAQRVSATAKQPVLLVK